MKTKQESVWDYPRPPRLEQVIDQLQIVFAGEEIVRAKGAFRVLETSHPPVYYIDRKWINPMYCNRPPYKPIANGRGLLYTFTSLPGKIGKQCCLELCQPHH
jgi:uncharacterized protein (DUF427 family)